MHEVAKYIGVSPMTVSRALSGHAKVKAKTRERVQAAIRKLGYVPDVAARNLAKGSTVQIGVIYNNPSSAYLNELLIGVLEQSRHEECQVILEKCGARGESAAIGKLIAAGAIFASFIAISKTLLWSSHYELVFRNQSNSLRGSKDG
jgi:LacI family transcriptional regulator